MAKQHQGSTPVVPRKAGKRLDSFVKLTISSMLGCLSGSYADETLCFYLLLNYCSSCAFNHWSIKEDMNWKTYSIEDEKKKADCKTGSTEVPILFVLALNRVMNVLQFSLQGKSFLYSILIHFWLMGFILTF